jgi:aminobenzoyl-glutamate utilization protein B
MDIAFPAFTGVAGAAKAARVVACLLIAGGGAALAADPPAEAVTAVGAASAAKLESVESIDRHAAELSDMADQIWGFAETALREHRSSKLLADYAQKKGFRVERNVAGMPTAFIASYGSGKPIIGILGEYDALPGLSQKIAPDASPLVEGAPGHGCGHNLFGAASLGAALAVKELIDAGKISGTVRYYGTPAEEDIGGKSYMARAGVFDDLDAVLAWHPSDKTEADTSSTTAMIDLGIEFRGRAAHAARDPWDGRSAVDALELFTHGVNMMREHIHPSSRMHYTIVDGGDVPNVVPEYSKVWLWLRDPQRAEVDAMLVRVRKLAEGAATMTETSSTVAVQGGSWEVLNTAAGARLIDANLRWLWPISYTEEEQSFARAIQRSAGVPEVGMDPDIQPLEGQESKSGSTDVGDVSWIVPTLNLTVATAPKGVPWHAWPVVASGGMSIGHKGLVLAAKTLAATAVDLYEQPAALAAVRADFEARKGDVTYQAWIPDGPPPLPKD